MNKFHKKDMRILQELDLDARQPASSIARSIGLSVESTNYRIRQLEKKGVIRGYYSLYNAALLGYNMYKVYVKLQNLSREREEELLRFLRGIPQVGLVAASSGDYDLEIGMVCRSLLEFHDVLERITKDYGTCIKSKDVTTNIEMWQFNRKYLFQNESIKAREIHYCGRGKALDVDRTDMEIIGYLAHNGRKGGSEIERALGISRKVVGYRVSNMTRHGLILGFRPVLDMEKLGLSYFRVLIKLQAMAETRVRQLFSYLGAHPNVVFLIKIIGSWELEVEVEIENSKKCHDLVMEIKHSFSDIVADCRTLEIFTYLKYEYPLFVQCGSPKDSRRAAKT